MEYLGTFVTRNSLHYISGLYIWNTYRYICDMKFFALYFRALYMEYLGTFVT